MRLVTHRRLGAQSTHPMAGKLFVARLRLWQLVRLHAAAGGYKVCRNTSSEAEGIQVNIVWDGITRAEVLQEGEAKI